MNTPVPWLRVNATGLAGVLTLDRQRRLDNRGAFSRLFCADELAEAGIAMTIAQINHSLTQRAGSARGLHCQRAPHGETKIITCLRGEVFDVAVDLRQGSPTFLQWHGEILSAANGRSLCLPPGCAHGFQTLTDACELLYLHSAPYAPQAEMGVLLDDPAIGIRWPRPFADLSARDRTHAPLDARFTGI